MNEKIEGAKDQQGSGMIPGTAASVLEPYASLIRRLRDPVDEGGYDGYYPDPLHVSAARAIEELAVALASQIEIANGLRRRLETWESGGFPDQSCGQCEYCAAWRKRAEEAEVARAQAGFQLGVIRCIVEKQGTEESVVDAVREIRQERDRLREALRRLSKAAWPFADSWDEIAGKNLLVTHYQEMEAAYAEALKELEKLG